MASLTSGDGVWLKKKSPKGVWQRRRFRILQGETPASNALVYFSNSTGLANPLGAILLCNVLEVAQDSKVPTKVSIRVEGGRVFLLEAENAEHAQTFLEAFGIARTQSHRQPRVSLPKLHDIEKNVKWWKPKVSREILLRHEYDQALIAQRKSERQPLDTVGAAHESVKQHQADKASKRAPAASKMLTIYNRVSSATAEPMYAALYSKPRFTADRSRMLSLADDYVLTRQGAVVTVPGFIEGGDTSKATGQVEVREALREDFSVALKMVFARKAEELPAELPRLSYKFSVHYSAASPNPIYVVPDDGKSAVPAGTRGSVADEQTHNPMASRALPRVQSSVDPEKGHPGFRAESITKAIEADEQKFFDTFDAYFSAALAARTAGAGAQPLQLAFAHVGLDYKKNEAKFLGSPYVSEVLKQISGTEDVTQFNEPEPNRQLIRAGRSAKFPEGLRDPTAEQLRAAEEELAKLEKAARGAAGAGRKSTATTPQLDDRKLTLTTSAGPSANASDSVQINRPKAFAGKPEGCLSIVFFGDLLPLDRTSANASQSKTLKRILERADLVLINLEAVVMFLVLEEDTNLSTSSNPMMHQDCALEYVTKTLAGLNIDPKKCVFSLANNHAGDFDVEGLERSIACIERIGAQVIGVSAGADRQKRGQVCKVTVTVGEYTMSIGFVAWTKFMNHNPKRAGLPVFSELDVVAQNWKDVKAKEGVDYLVGFVHWDYEYNHIPSPESTNLARLLLKAGHFDAIVGHGPHVLQPIELFDSKMRSRATEYQRGALLDVRGLCAYSLGNLASERGSWPTKMGGLFELILSAKNKAVAPLIAYKLVPFVQLWDALLTPTQIADNTSQKRLLLCAMDDIDVGRNELKAFRQRMDDLFELPRSVLKRYMEYKDAFRIRVRTSKQTGAGSRHPIYLSVKCDKGVSEEWYLETPYDDVENFKAGREDTFFVGSARELGDINVLKMQLKPINPLRGLGFGAQLTGMRSTISDFVIGDTTDSWHCDYVNIMRLADGKEWTFDVKQWVHPQRAAFIGSPKPALENSLPITLLNDHIDQMKTGDLILFESHSWYSDLTKKITKSTYSHVGILVVETEADIGKELEQKAGGVAIVSSSASSRSSFVENAAAEQAAIAQGVAAVGETPRRKVVLIYESTRNGDHTPDTTSGLDAYTGVHAFEIRQRIASYHGRLWWVPLQTKFEAGPEQDMVKWLKANHAKRTPYDYAQMIGAGLERMFKVFGVKNREDLSEMFCSEMVAAALRIAKEPSIPKNVSSITPADCAKFECYQSGFMGDLGLKPLALLS